MAPQLSQLGASSWKRANCSLRTAGLEPSIRSLAPARSNCSGSAFFTAVAVWPLPLPLEWPLPLVPDRVEELAAEPAVPGTEYSVLSTDLPSARTCTSDLCPLSPGPRLLASDF